MYRHLSDLRTSLLLRARRSQTGDDLVLKAEACSAALNEAARLLSRQGDRKRVKELLLHANALLDELDEYLLVLAHDEDQAVFAQLEVLREMLNGLADRRKRVA